MPKINAMRKTLILLMIISVSYSLAAQEEPVFTPVAGRYREFYISMSVEECKEALKQDGYFNYNDQEQPSLMRPSDEVLIDSPGRSFIKRGWFQFQDDRLIVMTIQLNPDKLDYYSVFRQLKEKYGAPLELSPQAALWRNEESGEEMLLSRPLEMKYRDGQYFRRLQEESRVDQSMEETLRERFLQEF